VQGLQCPAILRQTGRNELGTGGALQADVYSVRHCVDKHQLVIKCASRKRHEFLRRTQAHNRRRARGHLVGCDSRRTQPLLYDRAPLPIWTGADVGARCGIEPQGSMQDHTERLHRSRSPSQRPTPDGGRAYIGHTPIMSRTMRTLVAWRLQPLTGPGEPQSIRLLGLRRLRRSHCDTRSSGTPTP
jgi:hypothetical protein